MPSHISTRKMRTIISIKSSKNESNSSILLYNIYLHLLTPDFERLCAETNFFQLELGFFFFTYLELQDSPLNSITSVIFLYFTTTLFNFTIGAMKSGAYLSPVSLKKMTAQLEQMILMAILDNSEELHSAAQDYARDKNLTQSQIDSACKRVTSFLRWHGVQELLPKENKALIILQSFFRMLTVQKRLRKEMHYWQNLGKLDSMEHMQQAEKIYKVLYRPKKKRKICPYI